MVQLAVTPAPTWVPSSQTSVVLSGAVPLASVLWPPVAQRTLQTGGHHTVKSFVLECSDHVSMSPMNTLGHPRSDLWLHRSWRGQDGCGAHADSGLASTCQALDNLLGCASYLATVGRSSGPLTPLLGLLVASVAGLLPRVQVPGEIILPQSYHSSGRRADPEQLCASSVAWPVGKPGTRLRRVSGARCRLEKASVCPVFCGDSSPEGHSHFFFFCKFSFLLH